MSTITTWPTYPGPTYIRDSSSDRLRFALELIEESDNLQHAKDIARKALGKPVSTRD